MMFVVAAIILIILAAPIAAALAVYIARPDWFRANKKPIIGMVVSAVVMLIVALLFFGLAPPFLL